MNERPKKHVIFLGAGASANSGYPQSQEIRLCITSLEHFHKLWHENVGATDWKKAMEYVRERQESIDFFRKGGFSTVDEFCKLASESEDTTFVRFSDEIRRLTGFVLSCVNPESRFEDSEYYAFVQKVFASDLHSLRDDITVLNFNYDPYLEFLLRRACFYRKKISGSINQNPRTESDNQNHFNDLNAVTSGYLRVDDNSWLSREGFCVLKLHGIIYPFDALPKYRIRAGDLLERHREVLLKALSFKPPPSPIVFPWELLTEDLKVKNNLLADMPEVSKNIPLIWKRARREVELAKKISFVGLSMHPYLEFGLRYLFQNFNGDAQIVVANLDNGNSGHTAITKPWTTAGRVLATLKRVAPNLRRLKTLQPAAGGGLQAGPQLITVRNSFTEFIHREMDPVYSLNGLALIKGEEGLLT